MRNLHNAVAVHKQMIKLSESSRSYQHNRICLLCHKAWDATQSNWDAGKVAAGAGCIHKEHSGRCCKVVPSFAIKRATLMCR